jgi:hypothetical protein
MRYLVAAAAIAALVSAAAAGWVVLSSPISVKETVPDKTDKDFSVQIEGDAGSPGRRIDTAVKFDIVETTRPIGVITVTDTLIITGSGLLVAVTSFFIIAVLKRSFKKRDILSPYEAAAERLAALEKQVIEGTPGKELPFELSSLLRGYIKEVFSAEPVELTTSDLIERLGDVDTISPSDRGEFKDLLLRLDMAKFSGYMPDRQVLAADLATAKKLVGVFHKERKGEP